MSEWNHSAPNEQSAGQPVAAMNGIAGPAANEQKRKWAVLIAGSLGIALIGGILFQIFRPQSGKAGPSTDAGNARQDGSTAFARVDGHVISRRQLADECIARHGREVLENLINRTIIQQACAKRKIVVTGNEVKQEVVRIAKKFGLDVASWYQMLQAERGITPLQYHSDIVWPMLALKKIAGTKVEITNDEIKKAFQRHYGERVKARIIVLDNLRRASEVHRMVVQSPRDFSRIAQKHSIEPNSRALGGEIPPLQRHAGNPKLEEKAFRLRTGEISPVIQVGYNRFVIMICDGRTKQTITDIRTVLDELRAQLIEEKTQTNVAQVFEKLRREARVDNFLTNTSTGIKQTSGTKGGNARQPGRYPLPSNLKRSRAAKIK